MKLRRTPYLKTCNFEISTKISEDCEIECAGSYCTSASREPPWRGLSGSKTRHVVIFVCFVRNNCYPVESGEVLVMIFKICTTSLGCQRNVLPQINLAPLFRFVQLLISKLRSGLMQRSDPSLATSLCQDCRRRFQ